MRRRNFLGAVGALLGVPALSKVNTTESSEKTKPEEFRSSEKTKPEEFRAGFELWWPVDKTTVYPCWFVNAHSVKTEWTNKGLRIHAILYTDAKYKNQHGYPLVSKKDVVEVRAIEVTAPFGTFRKEFEGIKLRQGDTLNMNYDLNFDGLENLSHTRHATGF